MIDGQLVTVTMSANYYYRYIIVGRLRHKGGLEWELVGARAIRRLRGEIVLSELARNGPGDNVKLLPAAEHPESLWRPNVIRCLRCNEEAWADYFGPGATK